MKMTDNAKTKNTALTKKEKLEKKIVPLHKKTFYKPVENDEIKEKEKGKKTLIKTGVEVGMIRNEAVCQENAG